ncbi:uncharacterized protein [Amphiura filiformis]|uniref:uncharacterized protein n=1 Tax=Amphiura filiformis TaxID=82378 RepID=UPI003B217046
MDDASKNWYRITMMLPLICQYLAPFVDERVKWFHNKLVKEHGKKTCQKNCRPSGNWWKWNHCCTICSKWKTSLEQKYYDLNPTGRAKPAWSNSDPTLWQSDPWEVAKVYMKHGQRAGKKIRSVDELDPSSMLNLMLHCKVFGSNHEWKSLVFQVLDIRNKVFHEPSQKLPNGQFDQMQKTLIRFLDVGYHNFVDMPEKVDICQKIQELKTTTIIVSDDQWLKEDQNWKQMLEIVDKKLKDQKEEQDKILQDHENKWEQHEEMLHDIKVTQQGLIHQLSLQPRDIHIPGNQQHFTSTSYHPIPCQQTWTDRTERYPRSMIARGTSTQSSTTQQHEESHFGDGATSAEDDRRPGSLRSDDHANLRGYRHYTPAALFHALENVYSSQNEAEQHLTENCRRAGFKIHGHTPKDGNCCFHAVSDQLTLLGLPHQTAAELRDKAVSYLRRHPQIQGPDGVIDFRSYVPSDWTSYLVSMSKDGKWADAVILVAMARMLERDIMVVTSSRSSTDDEAYLQWIVGDVQYKGVTPIRLGHVCEVHYVSLEPVSCNSPSVVDSELKMHSQNQDHRKFQEHSRLPYNSEAGRLRSIPSQALSGLRQKGSHDSIRPLYTGGGYMGGQSQFPTGQDETPAESILLHNTITGYCDRTPKYKKRILLLYLDDDDKHVNTVYCLREVLKQKCCCNPVIMLDDHPPHIPFSPWFENEKKQADKIIIIFSKKARVYPDVLLKKREHAPVDKFWLAFKSCAADFDRNSTDKFLIAYFDYSSRGDVISTMDHGAVYELPRQLDKLMFQIHGINPSGPRHNYKAPELDLDHHATNDASSMNLSLAIRESRSLLRMERANSQEFDTQFTTLQHQPHDPAMATVFAQP